MPRNPADNSGLNTALMLAGTIAVLYIARDVFIPFSIALTLTFLLTPLVRWFQNRHLPKVVAVLLVALLSTVGFGAVAWVLGVQLLNLVNDLPQYRDNINARIQSTRIPNGPLRKTADNLKQLSDDLTGPHDQQPAASAAARRSAPKTASRIEVVEAPRSDFRYFLDLSKPALQPIGNVGLVLLFTVFMLIEKVALRNRLLRLAGVKRLNTVTIALDDAAKRVSRYLLMQLLVNITFGALFALGLFAIGIPNAALWGTLMAILRIVPYVGSLVGAMFPLVLSLAVFTGWLPPAMVVVLVIFLELVIGNFVEPMLYGAHTGISPLAILVTTVFWTLLWGPAGLILSTPLTVCVGVLGRYFPQLSFLHILIGDEPVLEPPALFYQRLLALDQLEARDVAELFLKEHSLVSLYDSVMIPALAMSERDRREGSLDDRREQFILFHVGEIISDLANFAAEHPLAEAADQKVESVGPRTRELPGRIFAIPASNGPDALAASMLVQILEQFGAKAVLLPVTGLWRSLHGLRPGPDDMICVSALHPFSSALSKSLVSKLQASFPALTIMLGKWGSTNEKSNGSKNGQDQPAYLAVPTLAAAVERIMGGSNVASLEMENKDRLPQATGIAS